MGTLAMGLVLAGVVAGLSAGVLGLGAGIVLMPAIFITLREIGTLPGVALPVAVATSLAASLPAALSLMQNDVKSGALDWAMFRHRVWLYAALGLAGGALVVFAPPFIAISLFVVIAVAAILYLFLAKPGLCWKPEPFADIRGWLVHGVIALLGSMTGAGTAVLTDPYLAACGVKKDRAAALATAYGAVTATAGAVVLLGGGLYFSAMMHGNALGILPQNSFGFINYGIFAVTAPVCFVVATFTTGFAGMSAHNGMRKVFAIFLLFSLYKLMNGAMPLFSGL